jgi:poly(3-hydroxybutyrate) depolymerase
LFAIPTFAKEKQKITRFTFRFGTDTRTVYAVIPEREGPMPLVILLHGSGRDGESLASPWKDLAAREGFMVAAPDAHTSAFWDSRLDPPTLFPALVEQMASRHAVDRSRVYLFGHSAGAAYALFLAVIDSELFAATAVHAGSLQANPQGLFEQAARKMPVAIWVGDRDQFFPVETVRDTKRLFDENGYHLELSVISGHDHNYYNISDSINQKVWSFLKAAQMPGGASGNAP